MSYLLKFNYDQNHHTFVLLEQSEYKLFCAREGGKRNFILHDVNHRLTASVPATLVEEVKLLLHNQELYNIIHEWLNISHIGSPLPQALISLVLNQLSVSTLVRMHQAVPFYRSLIATTLSQRFNEVEILIALADDEESIERQLENTDQSLIPLTMEILNRYLDIWDWKSISANHSLPLDFIEQHVEEVNWYTLSSNPVLLSGSHPEIVIDKFIDNVDWNELSDNPALATCECIEFLLERYSERWNWQSLSRQLSVEVNIIFRYQDRWDWSNLSRHLKLSEEMIETFIDRWIWTKLSGNESLTSVIIDRYLDRWDWFLLACNPALHQGLGEKYLSYIEKAVDQLLIGARTSLISRGGRSSRIAIRGRGSKSTSAQIQDSIRIRHELSHFAKYGYLSDSILKKFGNRPEWDWKECSRNPTLTMDMVEQYSWRISYHALSYNSNFLSQVTLDFIERHLDGSWNWNQLCSTIRERLPQVIDLCFSRIKDDSLLSIDKLMKITEADEYSTKEERLGEILSEHKDLTISFVLAHPEIEWDWTGFTCWAQWSWRDILEHPELPWSKEVILSKF